MPRRIDEGGWLPEGLAAAVGVFALHEEPSENCDGNECVTVGRGAHVFDCVLTPSDVETSPLGQCVADDFPHRINPVHGSSPNGTAHIET